MRVNRRAFLATSVITGLAGGQAVAAGENQVPRRLKKNDIPTPALLVDLDAFEANVRKMADHCKKSGCNFRPHAKTHKCPEIAKRQVAAGAIGISVATVPEAEIMVAAGIRGVLLTSPIIERHKIARMVAMAKKPGTVLLAITHPEQAELLQEAARAAKVTVDVLVDVDIGDRRTGVLPGKPALQLAQQISKLKNLKLRGVQSYAGHASHTVGFERRVKVSREAFGLAVDSRALIEKAGMKTDILTGGSTGTYNIDSDIKGVTELQVGSFIFMDVDYRRIGGRDGKVYTDFQPSLTVLTTVVSAVHPDRVSVDAGTKSFSTDNVYRPEAKGREGLEYQRSGDEFGRLSAAKSAKLPRLGDRLEFLVPHCDPTVNLYDHIYAVRGDTVEEIWPVLARKDNTR